jgi:hypothetical protein
LRFIKVIIGGCWVCELALIEEGVQGGDIMGNKGTGLIVSLLHCFNGLGPDGRVARRSCSIGFRSILLTLRFEYFWGQTFLGMTSVAHELPQSIASSFRTANG